MAYVAAYKRRYVAYLTAQLAQVVSREATDKDVRILNPTVIASKEKKLVLLFQKFDHNSLVIKGYAGSGFATNKDCSSQPGMIVTLCDKDGKAAILHYCSWKSRHATRPVIAADNYALSACYDYCFTVAHDVIGVLGFKVPIQLFTDSADITQKVRC